MPPGFLRRSDVRESTHGHGVISRPGRTPAPDVRSQATLALDAAFQCGGGRSSMPYCGAMAMRRSMSAGVTGGGGESNEGTGCAMLAMNFSKPGGVTRISIRAGALLSFLKACGTSRGPWRKVPGPATMRLPSSVKVISPSRMKNASSSRWWTWGGGPPPGSTRASESAYLPPVCSPLARMR